MSLNWDSIYAIALELQRAHPAATMAEVTLGDIYGWTKALPGFDDEPQLCNDEILSSIFQEWYEVKIHARDKSQQSEI
jgi:FeS assembly protein IscX